ncbi:MAG: ABC transporter ATP-binding protein, partial [Geminicoccaceae bacterium]
GVELDRVSVQFGEFIAVREAQVQIEPGEFFSFLGPSGCGKTTILRAVSGFLEPTSGVIRIGGNDMTGVGPNRRPTALIFQNLALFPLMRVWENIAFALEVKGAGTAERRRRADELLELIALPGQGDKLVSELSGGQKQRVAIARALCAEPRVLLLDEPLSALDLKLRQHLRSELRAIQRRVGLTFIYITHDQGEALTMSDHVAVMREGVIDQVADGRTIYDDPSTAFVASFVGENNSFNGQVSAAADGMARLDTPAGPLRGRIATAARGRLRPGDRAMLFVRPEALAVGGTNGGEDSITGRVTAEEFEGASCHLFLEGPGGVPVKVSLVNQGAEGAIGVGATVTLRFDPGKAVVLPPGDLAEEE